jgi:hypothetical protein
MNAYTEETPESENGSVAAAADNRAGEALAGFQEALAAFDASLAAWPHLHDLIFRDTAEWRKLLTYKLLPHLEGEGCLVVAVAGGTNTGKSTMFNLLLHADVSPVRTTAAATCRPVLAGNQARSSQCIDGRLMPEFSPRPLDDPELLIDRNSPDDTLYITETETLPDRLVLLDIPDVDSIDQVNWEVAENIRAAGDVLIAVLTGEKYKDERVVSFFQRAGAAGRLVLPLMNKANPRNDYEVARKQLEDFSESAGLATPAAFVVPHDFDLEHEFTREIHSLNGGAPLRMWLESLDTAAIKEQVYRETVCRFTGMTGEFLDRIAETEKTLDGVISDLEGKAEAAARKFDPQPGEKVGKLLHTYIQSKRGSFSRALGNAGAGISRATAPLSRFISDAVRERITLEKREKKQSGEEVLEEQRRQAEVLCRELLGDLIRLAPHFKEPAASIIQAGLGQLDTDAAVRAVADQAVQRDNISEAFRSHVEIQLENWWQDHRIQRRFLLELDTLLVVAPTAVAVPMAFYTGGVGVPEVVAAASPAAGAFFSRIMEYQLADHWFDLIAPWQREQRERFTKALNAYILDPVIAELREARGLFRGETAEALRRNHEQCRKVS